MITRVFLALVYLVSVAYLLPVEDQIGTFDAVKVDDILNQVDNFESEEFGREDLSGKDSSEQDSSEEDTNEENDVDKKDEKQRFLGIYKDRTLITERPIIGIVAQELSRSLTNEFGNDTYESYIGAAYVKWIEQAGARVVPVMINEPDEYYEEIFNKTNGLVIPGGSASIYTSGYANASRKIFDLALKAFDENDDYYPIWGTCLGFEFLAYITNNNEKNLVRCWAQDEALSLNITEEFKDSYFATKLSEESKKNLIERNVSVHYHRYCVSPDTYHNESSPYLRDFWKLLATNFDGNGTQFISLLEAKNYPVWGSQYHPEKNAYEWSPRKKGIPHSKEAIRVAAAQAEFFVDETRKNGHRFDSREDEESHLLYKDTPTWTGKTNIDWVMQQVYLYDK